MEGLVWKLNCDELQREWKVNYLIVINIDWILKKPGFESRDIIVSNAILHRKKYATLEVSLQHLFSPY